MEVGQTVLKLTNDTREAVAEVKKDLGEVHARDIARDATLREELNKMTQTLEKGHDILATRVDVIKAELDTAVARLSQAVPGAREPEASRLGERAESISADSGVGHCSADADD